MQEPGIVGLLVRARPAHGPALSAAAGRDGLAIEPLFQNVGAPRFGAAAPAEEWFLVRAPEAESPWDAAHAAAGRLELGLGAGEVTFAEPDLAQQFPAFEAQVTGFSARGRKGKEDPQDETLPMGPGFAWHLRPDFSQLQPARVAAGDARVRIAHLDTGYDPAHVTKPRRLLERFAWDFVAGRRGATDPGVDGVLQNPGHGTGTLSILAGDLVPALGDALGGAPDAEVIPIRIATSVVLFRTSALARALDYVLAPRADDGEVLPPVDVVSLSMGGLASAAWARAVNAAYEAGVCIVAASGNNFSVGLGGVPTRFVVYPARFQRVIAACGVMANRAPYYGLPIGRMQGNFGPASKMRTALAAFTPNMPWAELGAGAVVDMNGAGTSSATPQIAAAAALWIERHRAALDAAPEGWRRVEAVRHALFGSADRTADGGRTDKLGNGIVQAEKALGVAPALDLPRTAPDSAGLAFLKVLTGMGLRLDSTRAEMFALEAAQLAQQPLEAGRPNAFEELLPDPDLPAEQLPADAARRFAEALLAHPRASRALRQRLEAVLAKAGGARPPAPRALPAPIPPAPRAPAPDLGRTAPVLPPKYRRLRGYAFDPSLKLALDTAPISEVTFEVPWEESLAPGPVGEYLEVIDLDPASRCFYEPVDLDDRTLLAQDGLPPSEGNPRFHQQMVYAVASLTIRSFEAALGRPALWAPGPPPEGAHPRDDSRYVKRLRIHPHALRDTNAYYSPAKQALLLGYFHALTNDPAEHLPGGVVFTCLSHDIVAHETSHALLDGMHRRFREATNPDMPALHEAFADVVALLQHFTFPEILRHQIGRTRGALRDHESLLGQLATEFGRATGMRGALRHAIGWIDPVTHAWKPLPPDPEAYRTATEPHARGAVLVAAVFDAFLAIYERRTRDLLRLATGGTGVLAPGDIHPDLVARLADEAAKSARHVLGMCIRALDYLPPVDVTFGEYLRALVTADRDMVQDDRLGYRVAFIDAFRRRGIYPRDVRTLSEESLTWRGLAEEPCPPSPGLLRGMSFLRDFAQRHLYARGRREVFELAREMRAALHEWLREGFRTGTLTRDDAEFLGIDVRPGQTFEIHAARFANRVGPDGDVVPQFVIEVLQRLEEPLPRFEGGCTIIVDVRRLTIRYVIRKRVQSATRRAREQAFRREQAEPTLWDTYFNERAGAWAAAEPFALMHRR